MSRTTITLAARWQRVTRAQVKFSAICPICQATSFVVLGPKQSEQESQTCSHFSKYENSIMQSGLVRFVFQQ